jgi:hypothetical protein
MYYSVKYCHLPLYLQQLGGLTEEVKPSKALEPVTGLNEGLS